MTDQAPIFTRMTNVQDVFGVSTSTVYRWKQKGMIAIHKVQGCSVVRTDDMVKLFDPSSGPTGGPAGGPET